MYTQSKVFRTVVRGLIVISLALTTNVSNAADVLFEQAVIDPIGGFLAYENTGFVNGDDFSVAHVNVESIAWWGSYYTPGTDDFAVKIFDSLSVTPDTVLALSGDLFVSQPFLDTSVTDPQEYFRYELNLSTPLELLADNYFLSIQNVGTSEWVWLFGNPLNRKTIFYVDPDSSWTEDTLSDVDMAFSLQGNRIQTIPEPNTIVLLLLGCSMLIITRKAMKNTFQA